jgi:hypothetical protein
MTNRNLSSWYRTSASFEKSSLIANVLLRSKGISFFSKYFVRSHLDFVNRR